MSTENQFLTLKEVSQIFGLHTSTIKRLIDRGKFPEPLLLGTTRRFSRKAIEQFIARNDTH